eukprot:2338293-Rhodomonas_salina.6
MKFVKEITAAVLRCKLLPRYLPRYQHHQRTVTVLYADGRDSYQGSYPGTILYAEPSTAYIEQIKFNVIEDHNPRMEDFQVRLRSARRPGPGPGRAAAPEPGPGPGSLSVSDS